jgi:Uma2 family endonuclease
MAHGGGTAIHAEESRLAGGRAFGERVRPDPGSPCQFPSQTEQHSSRIQQRRANPMSTIASTQPTILSSNRAWAPPAESLYRLSLEQYEAMVASGIFTCRDRFHLIRGLLVSKMTQNTPHSTADLLCGDALERTIPPGWHVRPAKPIRIPGQGSKPEPDRSVARGGIRDYSHRDPEPSDIALVVEVADSRLREAHDLIDVYGSGGIPVYWIINLIDRLVEVYSNPGPSGYGSMEVLMPGHDLAVVIDGIEVGQIPVTDFLP